MSVILNDSDIEQLGTMFQQSVYESTCIPEAAYRLARAVRKSTQIPGAGILASELEMSAEQRTFSEDYHDLTVEVCDNLYHVLVEYLPDVYFSISGRRKSFVSEIEKRMKRFVAGEYPSARDISAIRVTILEDDSIFAIQKCYQVMNIIITYLARYKLYENAMPFGQDMFLLDSERRTYAGEAVLRKNNTITPKEIIVPAHSGIPPEYQFGVKDYIQFPKGNNYQSLHSVFQVSATSPKYSGHFFEVQVRTRDMDRRAEYGTASHLLFKQESLKVLGSDDWRRFFVLDENLINIIGYSYRPGESTYDDCGLFQSIPTDVRKHCVPGSFKKNHTF